MKIRTTLTAISLTACLAAPAFAATADEPPAPPAGSNMMGHSPASKEHARMNQTLNNASKAPETASAPDNGMGHSPASKEHATMNQRANAASKAPEAPAAPDNGMGHSQASKEHVMMSQKHRKAPRPQGSKPVQ